MAAAPLSTSAAQSLPDPKTYTKGLRIERTFSREGQDAFDSVEWGTRDAVIKNHTGEAIFSQTDVEFPKAWSQLASNVVASKYFYGDIEKNGVAPEDGGRERSLRQLIHRVTRTIADWGREQHYFATKADAERFYDELTWLCTNQYGAFNSPVWFNVGLHHQYGVRDSGGKTIFGWDAEKNEVVPVDPYERPQASACFIISVDDSIDDIWQLMGESARLFKFGSGVGAHRAGLRRQLQRPGLRRRRLPERQPERAPDRRVHAGRRRGQALPPPRRHRRSRRKRERRPGDPRRHCRGHAHLRRPRRAVRRHDPALAYLQEHCADQQQQSVQ
jgi:hypothetical protein